MQRNVRWVVVLLAVVAFGLGAYTYAKVPEHETIGAAARAGESGHFVTLTDGVTHYDVAGPDTGRVVVLVHGFSVPAYIWDSTARALSGAGYRVIRYDQFGRGLSDRPDVAYDGAMYDRQLDELLDSLHVAGPVDLAGVSFGGYVTAHYTAGHAARVRTLTLVDPVSAGGKLPWLLGVPLLGEWFWNVTQLPGKAESQYDDFLHPERYPTWADQYRTQMRYHGFGRALLRSAQTLSQVSFDSLYRAVAKTGVPVQLIWGRQDHTVPFELSKVARTAIPSIEFFPVDSSGHLPHIEQAALVNAQLMRFFEAHRAP
ncbi:MAG: alpha/beta hydrolase [Gemmatimonadetes bacterium]|nr:alpha/beta hydrolase [Gemmatimonadota bacterium]